MYNIYIPKNINYNYETRNNFYAKMIRTKTDPQVITLDVMKHYKYSITTK